MPAKRREVSLMRNDGEPQPVLPDILSRRTNLIFPSGPLNTETQTRYIGNLPAIRIEPPNTDIHMEPQSPADLLMSNHRRVMQSLRVYSRPSFWMNFYSQRDSGKLVGLDAMGAKIKTDDMGEIFTDTWGANVYDANRSMFRFPAGVDLGTLSESYMSQWAVPGGAVDDHHPLLLLAGHVYSSLHVNTFDGNAMFFLGFKTSRNFMEYMTTDEAGDSENSMIMVKMTVDTKIQEIEAGYIALMIARRFTRYSQKYGDDEISIVNVQITAVGITQYLTQGLYNPFIQAGPDVETVKSLMESLEEPTSRLHYARLKKELGTRWVLTSPSTVSQCVITATLLAFRQQMFERLTGDERNKLKHDADRLRSKLNLPTGGYKINEVLAALQEADLTRHAGGMYKVQYRTVSGREIGLITSPGIRKRMRKKMVIVYGGHALAVVRKPDDYEDEDVPRPMKRIKVPGSPIYKKSETGEFVLVEREVIIGAWDMETLAPGKVRPGERAIRLKPYMIGFTLGEEVGVFGEEPVLNQIQYHGLDCVEQFFVGLGRELERRFPLYERGDKTIVVYLYAHNGGRFDVPVIMDKLLAESDKEHGIFTLMGNKHFMERDNRIFKASLFFKMARIKVELRDSAPHLAMSLDDMCKIFDVDNPKLGGVDHKVVNETNFMEEIERQHLEDYLENDVLGLYQGLTAYGRLMKQQVGFDPILTGSMTSSAVPKNVFLSKYLHVDPMRRPWHISIPQDEYIRKAYHGGRTDVFFRGEWEGELNYLDFVSEYPTVMANEDLPVGPPIWHEEVTEEMFDNGFWGFVRIMVRGGNHHMNGIRVKTHSKGLIAPFFDEFTEATIFTEELRWILENDDFFHYEVRFLDGYEFAHEPFLKNITEDFFRVKKAVGTKKEARRNEMKAAGETGATGFEAEYALVKTNINSIYGHFAFKISATSLQLLTSRKNREALLLSGCMVDHIGRFALVKQNQDSPIRAVQVAAAVTAFAHLMILKCMVKIERAGSHVLYCDTDSVVTDMVNVREHIPIGDELGQMSFEMKGITSGIFVAPKVYALRSADHDHVKIKGIVSGPYLTREVETVDGRDRIWFKTKLSESDRPDEGGNGIMVDYDDLVLLAGGTPFHSTTTRFITGKRMVMRGIGVEIKPTHTSRLTGTLRKGNYDVGVDGPPGGDEDGRWVRALVGHGQGGDQIRYR